MASISPYVTSSNVRVDPGWYRNPFVRFFLWASKTDIRLMRLCAGSTRRTHVARGFFVLATAVGAGAAAYYFLYTTLSSTLAAGLIAPLFASAIFMFDRELVGGTSIRVAWVRILLSLVIGITIAIPFEMRLLSNRLDQEISRQELAENSPAFARLHKRDAAIDAQAAQLQNQLAQLRSQQQDAIRYKEAEVTGQKIGTETTGVRGKGPAYRAAEDRIQELQAQVNDVKAQLAGLQADRQRAESQFKNQHINAVYDFPSRYEAMRRYVRTYSPLWQLGLMITALIVLFDMFPVLSKILSPASDYDVLQRSEVAENIQRAKRLIERNRTIIDADLGVQPTTLEMLEEFSARRQLRE